MKEMKSGGGEVFQQFHKVGREPTVDQREEQAQGTHKDPRLGTRQQGHFQEASVARISGPWRTVQICWRVSS